jgi:CheY-like chemotaxis protein
MVSSPILIVDDDEDTCANLSDILGDVGYEVAVAYDGETALAMSEQAGHRLGLLDYKLPGMTGLELYRRLKQINSTLVAVLVTGFASAEVATAATAQGMRAVLPKPVDFTSLMPIIEEVVGTPLS